MKGFGESFEELGDAVTRLLLHRRSMYGSRSAKLATTPPPYWNSYLHPLRHLTSLPLDLLPELPPTQSARPPAVLLAASPAPV